MRCYSRQLLIRSLHFEELNFVLGKQKYKETTYFWWEWRELNTDSLCITNCEAIPKWISLWQIPSSIISTQWPTCTRGFILALEIAGREQYQPLISVSSLSSPSSPPTEKCIKVSSADMLKWRRCGLLHDLRVRVKRHCCAMPPFNAAREDL